MAHKARHHPSFLQPPPITTPARSTGSFSGDNSKIDRAALWVPSPWYQIASRAPTRERRIPANLCPLPPAAFRGGPARRSRCHGSPAWPGKSLALWLAHHWVSSSGQLQGCRAGTGCRCSSTRTSHKSSTLWDDGSIPKEPYIVYIVGLARFSKKIMIITLASC